MEPMTTIAIGSLLTNLFGNLFGASKQSKAAKQATEAQTRAANHAADLEYKAITEALDYQKQTDARDYRDWLAREARDRTDWEAQELRRAPFRALADSSVRTLADYIRVPGMQAAQTVPVQRWTDPNNPMQARGPMQGGLDTGELEARYGLPPGSIKTVGGPTSSTMPVGGGRTLYDLAAQPPAQAMRMTTTPDPRLLEKYSRTPRTLRDYGAM